MDFSYVRTGSGNAYLCPVMDAWDRDIVGDEFGNRCRAIEACAALSLSVMNRFGGRVPDSHALTLRVDRGPQFISCRFKETAKILNVKVEYAGIRCLEDKPYIESFFGKYKTEEVYRNQYRTLAEGRAGWEAYRAWYQMERLHQNLGYVSPKSFQGRGQICDLANDRKGGWLLMETASDGDRKKRHPEEIVRHGVTNSYSHNLFKPHFSPV